MNIGIHSRYLHHERDMVQQTLFYRLLLEDSLYTGAEAACNWLQNDTSVLGRQMYIPLLLRNGYFTQAQAAIAGHPLRHAEDSAFVELHYLILQVWGSQRRFAEMTQDEETQVRQLADKPVRVSDHAQTILNEAYGEPIPFFHTPSPEEGESYRMQTLWELEETQPAPSLRAFPNPASQRITFHLQNLVLEQPARLRIFTHTGSLIGLHTWPQGAADLELPLDRLPPGIYGFSLSTRGALVAAGRFSVIR